MREKVLISKNEFNKSVEYLNLIKKMDISDVDFTDILGYDLNKMQVAYLKEKYPKYNMYDIIKVMINIPKFVKEMNDEISKQLKR